MSEAIGEAYLAVAAGTGIQLVVVTAQSELKIRSSIEVWNREPAPSPGWQALPALPLTCPSGHIVMGNFDGVPCIDFALPGGPGEYRAVIQHRGRQEAIDAAQELPPSIADLTGDAARLLHDRYAGLEQYRIALWKT